MAKPIRLDDCQENIEMKIGFTLLHEAAYSNDSDFMEMLINEGATINAKDEYGNTPLHMGLVNGSIECIKLLLKAGADPNENNNGETHMHLAACHESNDCLQLLIEAGGNLNEKNAKGSTPLHKAAFHDSKECMKLLLESGADIHAKNNRGETFLDRIRDRNLRKEIGEYIRELSTIDIKEPSC